MFDFMELEFSDTAVQDFSGPYLPDAGECMRCGRCIRYCPTYKLFEIEGETPRSRVRTIHRLLNDETVTEEEITHLNGCLQCRACETVCPSQMAYGHFFDQAQAKLEKQIPVIAKWGLWFIEHKVARNALLPFVWLYQKTLSGLLRKTPVLEKLGMAGAEALITTPALTKLSRHYTTQTAKRGQVALFAGCLAEHFDRETLDSAIRILNAIGFDVLIPEDQGCCGAIHQHTGLSAADLIQNNLKVFNALDVEAVLYTASGCGAMLSQYTGEAESEEPVFGERLRDINSFILANWPEDLTLNPAAITVAVHEPCSQRNVLKNQQAVYDLLAKIPALDVSPLPDNGTCCGAGGSYMLTHPENAQALRRDKIAEIDDIQPERVVTSNFGCALFMAGDSAKISHPLTLLMEQL